MGFFLFTSVVYKIVPVDYPCTLGNGYWFFSGSKNPDPYPYPSVPVKFTSVLVCD
jgi:hypothetical protein